MAQPEIMTIEEVAQYLRVSERTVYDWAQKGEIPCGKLGTAWRFRRADIERWIDSQLQRQEKKADFVPLFISSVLKPEHTIVRQKASKADILNEMIKALGAAPEIKSEKELSEGIFHREKLMSTGIGLGIGIPHVRLRSVKDVVLAAALVKEGVADYESLDYLPVKLIFMIVARQDQHAQHLKLLSQISTRLKSEDLRNALLECEDRDSFYNLLVERGQ